MSNSDNHSSASKEPSLGDDGRSLWWAIPAVVASVLGIAGSVIARSRRRQPVRFPQQEGSNTSVPAATSASAEQGERGSHDPRTVTD